MSSSSSIPNLQVQVTNRQILSIALPITLAIFIPQVNLLMNSIFLGRLSEEALGNAGITGVYYLIFAVAGNGLNNALQTVFSRYAGSGETSAFKTIFMQGIRISLVFAVACILFTWLVAPYIMQRVAAPEAYPQEMAFLRIRIFGLPFLYLFQLSNAFLVSSLNSRLLLIGFICDAAVNVVLDYVFIFGHFGIPAMGFNGAAWASVIAEAVGMVVVWLVMIRSGLKQQYGLLENRRYDRKISLEIIHVSLPLVLQYIISVTTWLIFFLLIESRGIMAKAISNTMRNVFGLAGVFVWAFAGTTNNMVSNLIGQKKLDQVLPCINRIMFWSMGLCSIMVLLLNLFPEAFFQLFGQDETFVQEGIPVIRVVSLGMLFMSMANIWLNGVTGTGQTRSNLIIEIVAIAAYLGYTWYFMRWNYVSLAMAWSNEVVYWSFILLMAFVYLRKGHWRKAHL